MATSYAETHGYESRIDNGGGGLGPTGSAQWHEPQRHSHGASNFRSVTPAMNNTRGAVRNGSNSNAVEDMAPSGSMRGMSPGHAARPGGAAGHSHYENRSATPNRSAYGFENSPSAASGYNRSVAGSQTPSSSGLIRLTLRKPMGIVFEPMYDPNAPTVQRGVRICDLPRTGAAALSRRLEIGDELLSINDKTMSRLTFDEIMDFIIQADADEVNLLFRRPRKEALNARSGIKTPSNNAAPGNGVKWVDDEHRNKKKPPSDRNKKNDRRDAGRRGRRGARNGSSAGGDDDETFESEDQDSNRRRRKKGRRRKDPYESESFLDMLIDTICANPDNVCRDRRRRDDDDDYYSDEDDGTYNSRDDSTYVTYESDKLSKRKKQLAKAKAGAVEDEDEGSTYGGTEEDTTDDRLRERGRDYVRDRDSGREHDHDRDRSRQKAGRMRSRSPQVNTSRIPLPENAHPAANYEDDGTLETVDSNDRPQADIPDQEQAPSPPLGLAHEPPQPPPPAVQEAPVQQPDIEEDVNPAPIREVEYDDQVDHGADVSVMESLGGPSLLIEKQRQAAIMAQANRVPQVPRDIIDNFGDDYPVNYGFSLEQTIQQDPLKFYSFVVKSLLEENEPEKVRLLDKLMAKYKGREDHLVQKLSVRYNKSEEDEGGGHPEPPANEDDAAYDERVVQSKDEHHMDAFGDPANQGRHSENAHAQVEDARPSMYDDYDGFAENAWPEKETKMDDAMVPGTHEDHEDGSGSGSEYSEDAIDGTSPAVIANVSELLNYVYGKTSVPAQIDRVSTIMRAYEGREAVLLELLETKALMKANREKENAANLPAFLRNSASAQQHLDEDGGGGPMSSDVPPVTPMATQGQETINDDISSMSGVSSPVVVAGDNAILKQIPSAQSPPSRQQPTKLDTRTMEMEESYAEATPSSSVTKPSLVKPPTPDRTEKKKKKGLFGGLFKKNKKGKDSNNKGSRRSRGGSAEGSI